MERITEKKLIELGFKKKISYFDFDEFGITYVQYKKGKITIKYDNGFYFYDFELKNLKQFKSLYYGLTRKEILL